MNNIPGRRWIFGLVLALSIVGGFLRIYKIKLHPFWYDEVSTGAYSSGVGLYEEQRRLVKLGIVTPKEFLFVDGDYRNRPLELVSKLIVEDSKHSPGFYLVSNALRALTGDHSRYADRYFSAFFSVFLIPLIFFLVFELSNSFSAALIACCLITFSPLIIAYSQEAREYGATLTFSTSASLSFLKAVKNKKKKYWILYGVFSTVALYLHFFYILISIGHCVYLVSTQYLKRPFRREMLAKTIQDGHLKSYLISIAIAFALYIPWLCIAARTFSAALKSPSIVLPLWQRVFAPFAFFVFPFQDMNLTHIEHDGLNRVKVVIFCLTLIGVLIGGAIFLKYSKNIPIKKYVVSQFLAHYVAFALIYLIGDRDIFLMIRYTLPTAVCSLIAYAQLSSEYLVRNRGKREYQGFFVKASLVVISLSFAGSLVSYYRSPNWWYKFSELDTPGFVAELEKTKKSSVIITDLFMNLVSIREKVPDQHRIYVSETSDQIDVDRIKSYDVIYIVSNFDSYCKEVQKKFSNFKVEEISKAPLRTKIIYKLLRKV